MKTILLVEDEEVLREVVQDDLSETGYKVLVARTGAEAMEQLEKIKPDLAVLDVKLPDTSGLKLLEQIRKMYPALPIMMCTAFDSFKTDYEVWASKVSDYIVKPVDLKDLRKKIKKLIGL